jgi:hypothetical protein
MNRLNKEIQTYQRLGFTIDIIDNKTAIFSYKDEIKFKGFKKWDNTFNIDFFKGNNSFEVLNKRMNLIDKLLIQGYISRETYLSLYLDLENFLRNKNGKYSLSLKEARENVLVDINRNPLSISINSSKLKHLLVILPKSTREEFIADLSSIIEDMKVEKCSKPYIVFVITLHFISVAYHAFFFKLKDYFYPNKQQSNKN